MHDSEEHIIIQTLLLEHLAVRLGITAVIATVSIDHLI